MSLTNTITGVFFFDPADEIYAEHFPGNPVVPGSVIIHAFFCALTDHKVDSSNHKVKNFRFKKFISPGEYLYTISTDASKHSCKLYNDNKAAVTGEIMICN